MISATETEFQGQVIQLATTLSWRHMHVRRSIGKGRKWTTATNVVGWPDLVLVSPRFQRVIFAELKSETGKPTPEQLDVLGWLQAAGQETAIWRPSNLDHIALVLNDRAQAHVDLEAWR